MELVVSLALVAALIALLALVPGNLRRQVNDTRCLSNLRSLGQALYGYLADHHQTLPGPMYFGQSTVYNPGNRAFLTYYLAGYLGTPLRPAPQNTPIPEFACPEWKRRFTGTIGNHTACYTVTGNIVRDGIKYSTPFGNHRSAPVIQPARLAQLPGDLSTIWAIRDPFDAYGSGPDDYIHGRRRNFLYFDGHVGSRDVDPARPDRDPNL